MPTPIRILHLEDHAQDAEIIQHKLEAGGLDCDIVRVDSQTQFASALAGEAFDVILCDYNIPGYDGISALKLVRGQHPETPVILISGSLGEEEAVKCLQHGATDYLLKQKLDRLPAAVKRALQEASELRRRHLSEAVLARERTLLLALIDNVPDYIYLKDTEGRFLLANFPTVQFFGFGSVADVLGKTVFELFPRDIAEPFAADDRTVVATGKPIMGREEPYAIEGRRGWFSTTKVPLRDADGKITGLVGITLDITERKQAEEQLRRSEARLADAQRIARLGNWELDLGNLDNAGHNRLRWSDEVFRIFGYQPGEIEVSNENFFRAVHPEDRPRIQAAMSQAVRDRQPYNFVHRIVLPDGAQRIVHEQSELLFDEQSGQPMKMVGTVQDITELKKTEEALRDSEALYQSLVEHLPLSVFRKDREGRLTFANASFCAAVGKPLNEVFGQTDFEIAPADLAQKYRDDDRRVMETGEVLEQVEENRFLAGKTRFIQVLKAPLRNADGEIIGIQGIFMDVTERKELEEKLRQSQKMDAIGQLAGGVAHDFNNLLTIIQGYSQLLLTQTGLPGKTAEQLREIYSAGERAADLTRQLLTFSRKQQMTLRALDLNESIREITKMLQRIIGENITLQCAFAPALPFAVADAGMIHQILLNLSVNARDAMPKGGRLAIETAVVELNAEQAPRHPDACAGRFVSLSVQDNGSGIAPEHLEHIFEPFFTTKDVGKGTGLGLATVFGIVQQHQGWIEVDSTVGTGTTFKVFLPAAASNATSFSQETRKVLGGTETILVVEDEPALRHLALIMLRKHGYRVLEAASGVKALPVWEEHAAEIDLLLTDLMMPDGMTGHELAEQLRAKRPNLKVIYISGYSPEFAGADLALKEGINFLQKPFPPHKLLQTVRDCLDK